MATWHQSRAGLSDLFKAEPGIWKAVSDTPHETAYALRFDSEEKARIAHGNMKIRGERVFIVRPLDA